MPAREFNFVELFRLFEDFKNDMKQLLSMVTKNKNSLADVKKDFKRFLDVMEKMTKEENMKTFKKFVNELEKFNKNAEKMSKELEEMKGILGEVAELARMMRGD